MDNDNSQRKHLWPVWIALALYSAARLMLIPADGATCGGFGHDSAYIVIVADNLLAGRGFVNDASWLVFLQPERLPMPYHNANPLYPTLIAGVSYLSGQGTIWAGFAVSALSSSLLFAALFVLARKWIDSPWQRAAIAAAGTFFPVVFEDSLSVTPDALCTALLAWLVVLLVRCQGMVFVIMAGICLGLAWLTRSSVILAVPAVCVFWWMRDGTRLAAARTVTLGAVAVAVVSPWFIHTAAVWGNPLRSDSGYYLLQDYHARAFDGSVDKYWHSTAVPAGPGEVLRSEPTVFASFYLTGLPIFFRNLFGAWGASRYAISALLVTLFAATGWQLRQRWRPTPAQLALVVYTMTAIGVFTVRAKSLEVRYLAPLSTALAAITMVAVLDALLQKRRGVSDQIMIALGAAWWLLWTPYQDYRLLQKTTATDLTRVEYERQARIVNDSFGRGGPVIVGDFPYFFTLATGAPSLSIPTADDDFLLATMRRHQSHWLFLTEEERKFWRPDWQDGQKLPAWLRLKGKVGEGYLYQRSD